MINRYFLINKPYNMVSQFISPNKVRLLGDLDFNFPEGTHAIGRLDSNSEGLLILTTNKKVTKLLFEGPIKHKRTYLVQVVNNVSQEKLLMLQSGVKIRTSGDEYYTTPLCSVEIVTNPLLYCVQATPLPHYIPITWLLITLTEGKYRQVRKMVAAINHRCKRLIRVSIENLRLNDLKPGEVKELDEAEFFEKAGINFY